VKDSDADPSTAARGQREPYILTDAEEKGLRPVGDVNQNGRQDRSSSVVRKQLGD
jgi:hypothetical protein